MEAAWARVFLQVCQTSSDSEVLAKIMGIGCFSNVGALYGNLTGCLFFLLSFAAAADILPVANGDMEAPSVGAWSRTLPANWTWSAGSGVGDVGLTSTGGANSTRQCLYGNQLAGQLTSASLPQGFTSEGTATLTYWSKRENFGSFNVTAKLMVGGVTVSSRTDTFQGNLWTKMALSYTVSAHDIGKTVQIEFAFSGSGAWQGYLDEVALAFTNSLPTIRFEFCEGDIVQQEMNAFCTVSVVLAAASTNTVSVGYNLTGGSAIPGTDFVFTPGRLSFPPGAISNGFSFSVLDDVAYGGTKSLTFCLTEPTNATTDACSCQTVIIVDPEDRPPARDYYVDSAAGNDVNSGTNINAPWRTLSKLNTTSFAPGDRILLKAGSAWTGQLRPMRSGDFNSQITIDRYGDGPKPAIAGGGIAGGALYLLNQQYWSINNLDLSNYGSTNIAKKQGILIKNDCVGTLNGIYVRDCFVHDVNGTMEGYIDGKESGGIVFYVTSSNTNRPSKWNDIRIENNVIRDVAREGILLQSLWVNKPQDPNTYWSSCGPYYPSTQVRIASNILERIGGDGIIPWAVNGAVIEYNYIRKSNWKTPGQGHAALWPYICENVIFQFNEVCETQTKYDGMAFDFDNSNQNCVYQYNYSHDNEGGFLNMCSGGNANNNIARYNISQNDGCISGGRIFLVYGGGNHNYSVYNNTVFVSSNSPNVFQDDGGGSSSSTINFHNNIIVNRGSGSVSAPAGCTFDHNLFFGSGYIASDANRLTVDPKLVAAGTASNGFNSAVGYKLMTNSPALRTGRVIPANGGLDFWQNPVSATAPPNLGAYNGSGVPEIPSVGTNLTWTISSTNLVLSWPSSYIGWSLWVQTNRTAYGLSSDSNDWTVVPGSNTTNRIYQHLDPSAPGLFYRMAQ